MASVECGGLPPAASFRYGARVNGANSPRRRVTLATRVTILRLLGIPVFMALTIAYTRGLAQGDADDSSRVLALGVFALVAVTDALDGYLARVRKEVTPLGRVLDPLADKALLLSGLLLLTRPDLAGLKPHIPIWFTSLVLLRDATLVYGYFRIRRRAGHVEVHPRWTGKLATVLQMATVLWVLAELPEAHFLVLISAAALFTAIAGVQYGLDGARQLAQVDLGSAPPKR